jgi:hypothetical protein
MPWVATMIAASHPLKRCAEAFDERAAIGE